MTNFYVHVTALYVTLDKDQEVFNQDNTFFKVSWIRAIAAATCLLLILKLFDWCRLFDETAFFITLIIKTLKDIGSFIQLMFLAVFCFGVPLMILQLNAYRDLDIVEPVFDFWVADLFVSQYLLILGDWDLGNWKEHPSAFTCYVLFFLATFISQVVMMNMMVAIMGDTYSEIMENKQVSGIKTKIELISEVLTTKSNQAESGF